MLIPALNEKGETLSPLLPAEVKNFLIDIDGTICDDIPNEEPERMVDVPLIRMPLRSSIPGMTRDI